MSTPGWYPDPSSDAQLRYWDGSTWTTHVAPRPAPQRSAVAYPAQGAPGYGAAHAYEGYAGAGYPAGPTTADGVPLAGYGARVGAYLIDGAILFVLGLLAGWPFLTAFYEWFEHVIRSGALSGAAPSQAELMTGALSLLWPVLVINLALMLAYHTFFLVRYGATLGKLALGLRVRRVGRPGPLSVTDALKRQALPVGLSLASWVPVVSYLQPVATLVDLLFPLWDRRRQTVHDKIADTLVVAPPRRPRA